MKSIKPRNFSSASVVGNDPALLAQLMPAHYQVRPEQVILFKVNAWEANCPQHIPRRYEAADVARALAERDQRIAELEAQVRALQALPNQVTRGFL